MTIAWGLDTTSQDAPPFPTPSQWVRGEGITVASVGFDRYINGGRPHTLMPHLRVAWESAYRRALDGHAGEPEAWRVAWKAAKRAEVSA